MSEDIKDAVDVLAKLQEDVAVTQVLATCSHSSLLAARQVCKVWHQLATTDSLWHSLLARDFPHAVLPKELPGTAHGLQSYRRKWQLERNWMRGVRRLEHVCEGHRAWVTCVRLARAAGVVLSGGADGQLAVWGLDGVCSQVLTEQHGSITSVDAGRQLAASCCREHKLMIWDLASGECAQELCDSSMELQTRFPGAVQLLEEEHLLLTAHLAGGLFLWDLRTGKPQQTLHSQGRPGTIYSNSQEQHSLRLRTASAQLHGSHLVSGGCSGLLDVYDLRRSCKLATLDAHEASIRSMHMKHGRLATGSFDGSVKLWDWAKLCNMRGDHQDRWACTAEPPCPCIGISFSHDLSVHSVRLSDEWQMASAGRDGTVRIWRAPCASGDAYSCCSSLDCQFVMTPSTDDEPGLTAVGNSPANALTEQPLAVQAVDIDETHIVAGGKDSLVRIYSVESQAVQQEE